VAEEVTSAVVSAEAPVAEAPAAIGKSRWRSE